MNRELEALEELLRKDPLTYLSPAGGRLVVMAFHSLEDRPVKRRFRALVSE